MAIITTNNQHYMDIADAIREKLNSSDTYTPAEMADAIMDIPTGGVVSGDLPIIGEGVYDVSSKATATYIYPMPFRAYINTSGYYWAYYNDSSTSFCFPVTPGNTYTLTWTNKTWGIYRVGFTKTTSGPSQSSTSTSYRRSIYDSSGESGLELTSFESTHTFTIPSDSDLKLCVIQITATNNDWVQGTIASVFREAMTHLTITISQNLT